MIAAGIDIGSITAETVLVQGDRMLASVILPTGANSRSAAERSLKAALDQANLPREAITRIVATGYGRASFSQADKMVTEITCHARGAFSLTGRGGLLIDMGGQDTKVIRLGPAGEVLDFAMNDKCSAGTGRFLEVILARLQVPMDEVAGHAAGAERAVTVSSTCTVFAESEVISLVAEGAPLDGIVRGLHAALASRVAALARIAPGDAVFLSGGVARNAAMVAALAGALGRRVSVLPDPQLVGALGAALSAQ